MMKNILFLCLFLPVLTFAGAPLGEHLTKQLWKDINAGKIEKITHYTSKNFQFIVNNYLALKFFWPQYLTNLHTVLNGKTYKFLQIQVTRRDHVITVSYVVTISDPTSIESEGQTLQILDVWKKINGTWKLGSESTFYNLG